MGQGRPVSRPSKLGKQRAWRGAGDRAELRYEMGLVVIAGGGSDARPARIALPACRGKGTMEARQLGERLRADAKGLAEHPAKMPLAHPQLPGDRFHVAAGQPARGVGGESCRGAGRVRRCDAFGDGVFQDGGRGSRVGCDGESIEQAPGRGAAPQVFECDDAPGDCRGRQAKHRLIRIQVQAREYGALPAADELSMDRLLHAQRMHVDTIADRSSQANDELDVRAWKGDARHVALAFVDQQFRHAGGGRSARHAVVRAEARRHAPILGASQWRRKPVRFFQFRPLAGR